MAATYRQLDRSRDEIRLLKILPPEVSSTGLYLSPEVIRCELQYESMDAIKSRTIGRDFLVNLNRSILFTREHNNQSTNTDAATEVLARELSKAITLDYQSTYQMSSGRKQELQLLHQSSTEALKGWLPHGLNVGGSTFEWWLRSWIWTPLSDSERHLEVNSPSYFALSYVWSDPQQSSIHTDGRHKEMDKLIYAAGSTPRQFLENNGEFTAETLDIGFDVKDGPPKAQIILDNEPVLIEQNLEKALRAPREIPEVQRETRIWADALCINQEDIAEKNIEVKRMGDIYKNADRVISWLGDEEDQSGQTLEFICAVRNSLISNLTPAPDSLEFIQKMNTVAALRITELLLRPYWSRIWIVQEIAMGGDRSIAICGARRFPMFDILKCGKMLNSGMTQAIFNLRLELHPKKHISLGDLQAGLQKMTTLHDAKIDSQDPDRDVPGSNTLWFKIASSSNATNAKDRVYGMLNLLPRKLATLINIDYSSSIQFVDVMAEFAMAHIKCKNSLDWIFHRLYLPIPLHMEWPSWVPNLALPYSSAHWMWAASQSNACPDTEAVVYFSNHIGKHFLTCQGYRLDTINQATRTESIERVERNKEIIQSLLADPDQSQHTLSTIAFLRAQLLTLQTSFIPDAIEPGAVLEIPPSLLEHKYNDRAGLKNALAECFRSLGITFSSESQSIFDVPLDLEDNNLDHGQQTPLSFTSDVSPLWLVNGLRTLFAEFDLWGQPFKNLFPPRHADVDSDSFSLPSTEDRTWMFGRLFTTCAGYVGACICNVCPGDEVFLLHGCRMPVVLRPMFESRDVYRLQGGVYIACIMKGETFTQLESLGIDAEMITIC
jgi:hypothetical protein